MHARPDCLTVRHLGGETKKQKYEHRTPALFSTYIWKVPPFFVCSRKTEHMDRNKIDTRIQGNSPDGVNRTRGQKLMIPHPGILLEHALAYMQEVDENPLQVADAIRSGNNAGKLFNVPKQRPYTANGFGVYLVDHGVVGAFRTFLNYWHNSSGNAHAFVDTVDYIKNKMFAQKFEGAAAGIFNYAIIAAELGLKTQTEHTEKTINLEVDVSQLSDAALEEIERVAASQQQ